MILTSNRGFAEWGEVFGDPVVATALLDRLLHHAIVIQIEGSSYRLRQHADLVPEHIRSNALIQPSPRPRRSSAAVDRRKTEALITQTADRHPAKWGKLHAPKWGIPRPVDNAQAIANPGARLGYQHNRQPSPDRLTIAAPRYDRS